ncbi:hypothetical protein, partial [Bradyrhizobium sp.]|uniref:hypothetical protein n=1 Tax=Bradyrhizobium sp. TaxID=376 RepID=UPI003BB1E539
EIVPPEQRDPKAQPFCCRSWQPTPFSFPICGPAIYLPPSRYATPVPALASRLDQSCRRLFDAAPRDGEVGSGT